MSRGLVEDEESLIGRLRGVEEVINAIDNGTLATKDAQAKLDKCIDSLHTMTLSVTELSLFSSNESMEELTNGSLSCMLIPCYLGVCHMNKMEEEPSGKIDQLRMAKVYFRDYLKRIREYSVIEWTLPWEKDEEQEKEEDRGVEGGASAASPVNAMQRSEDLRKRKMYRFKEMKEQQRLVQELSRQRHINGEDDSTLRELAVAQLRYWAHRSIEELESIDREVPMLEHMARLRSGEVKEEKDSSRLLPSSKPFIITRDAAQKAVFGLGYPSIPVMTVDEWYDERVKKGAFAQQGGEESKERRLSDSENEDDGRDDDRRAQKQRWDEYKDEHRRGWGNMHNKG